MIQALSRSSFWAILLSVPLKTQQCTEEVAALLSCAIVQPCIHYNGEQKSAHARTHIHTHSFIFLWWQLPEIGPGGAEVLSWSGQFNYVTVKQLRIPWHFDIPSEMGILCDLSEFVLTVQVKWSTCPTTFERKPIHWEYRGKPADPGRAWTPSYPFSGDQGHIYRDVQRTMLQQMTIASCGSRM